MKIHYWGERDGYAYCGASVPTNQLTAHASSITCKLCLRHLSGLPRKPVEERKEGRHVRTSAKTHWVTLDQPMLPVCGERRNGLKVTHEQDKITCGRCLRLLGIEVDTSGKVPDYLKNDPLYTAISTRALDSLLGRAFKQAEGELAVALVEAEKALADATKMEDPADVGQCVETIAVLSGALRRLVDLLGSKTSN